MCFILEITQEEFHPANVIVNGLDEGAEVE